MEERVNSRPKIKDVDVVNLIKLKLPPICSSKLDSEMLHPSHG
jgi:hypothetical protein